jgi:hypothetical protein
MDGTLGGGVMGALLDSTVGYKVPLMFFRGCVTNGKRALSAYSVYDTDVRARGVQPVRVAIHSGVPVGASELQPVDMRT